MSLKEKKSVSEFRSVLEKTFDLTDADRTDEADNQAIDSENLAEDKAGFLPFNPAIAVGIVLAGSLGLAFFAPAIDLSISPCGAKSSYQSTK